MTDRTLPEALAEFCEDRRRPLGLAVAILLFVLLAGCAQVPIATGPAMQQVAVVVNWSSQEQIAKACGPGQKSGGQVMGCYVNGMIYAPPPSSWSDDQALAILGHELMHAMGAIHE